MSQPTSNTQTETTDTKTLAQLIHTDAQTDLGNIKKSASIAKDFLASSSADLLTGNSPECRLKQRLEHDKQALLSLAIQQPENKEILADTGDIVPCRRRTDGVGLYGGRRVQTTIRIDPGLYAEFKEVALRTMGSTCSAIESIMAGYIGTFKQDKVNFGNTMTINGFTVNRNMRERRLAEPETITAGAVSRVVDDLRRRVIVDRREVWRRLGEEPDEELPGPGKPFERLVFDVENNLRHVGCLVVSDKDKVAYEQIDGVFRPFIGRAVEELRGTVTDDERSVEGYRGLRDRVSIYVEARYPSVDDRFRKHVVNHIIPVLREPTPS